jgi:tryptophan-rich sensory protein
MGNAVKLVIAIALPLAVGALSGLATARGVATWYPTLVKPSFNPPAWVFGPVWTDLYVMMGVAAFLV